MRFAKRWARSDTSYPTFNPPVELGAPAHLDPEAAVVPLGNVLADGLRVVPLQRWVAELVRWGPGHALPESLGSFDVSAFVDVDLEDHVAALDARDI